MSLQLRPLVPAPHTPALRLATREIQGRVMSAEAGNSAPASGQKSGDDAIVNARNEKRWNRFHDYFKAEFELVYELADGSFTTRGMSTKMYLAEADDLRKHLTMHHTIEERHIFPLLAKRMPAFRNDEQHIKSHHGIHEGLDKLSVLLKKWNADPTKYSPDEMKACLDSWRDVLFRHLDEEVADLGGENMCKYWTLEEIDRIPF
ncbi:hypothetical protein EIP86_003353 [Pleurotus ostreatoroseus]|nr:hypothetical protein EIP86_003353 [Pleurotus ostreatoroseus]